MLVEQKHLLAIALSFLVVTLVVVYMGLHNRPAERLASLCEDKCKSVGKNSVFMPLNALGPQDSPDGGGRKDSPCYCTTPLQP
jgi:hypothetical protein